MNHLCEYINICGLEANSLSSSRRLLYPTPLPYYIGIFLNELFLFIFLMVWNYTRSSMSSFVSSFIRNLES